MKIRRSIIAAAVAVILGGTGAVALPAVASTHSATTTLKFTAAASKVINWDNNTFAYKETDRNSAGVIIGFDVAYFQFVDCCLVSADVAFALRGGLLYGTFEASGGTIPNGKVTGGTGVFTGVTGTITGTTNQNLTKMRFTITYS